MSKAIKIKAIIHFLERKWALEEKSTRLFIPGKQELQGVIACNDRVLHYTSAKYRGDWTEINLFEIPEDEVDFILEQLYTDFNPELFQLQQELIGS